tara:strand:+ start:5291 stop:5761 length:471 start_codon:yes stop_codon:yes gene_type:complete
MKMKNTVSTGIELLYRNRSLVNIPFEDNIVKEYNNAAFELDLEDIVNKGNWSKEFNIPQHYKDLDVEKYITRLIPASGQDVNIITARVDMELAEFKARNLFSILQLLIYIIDTMRKNNLVWGVGRGSSVASYILYLLGVHKVDSVKYNLDIKEFLK